MPTYIENSGRLSRAVVANGFAFLSGITARDRSKGFADQTHDVLEQIDGLLKAAGAEKSKLVVANIWLKSADDFTEFNKIWDKWVDPSAAPARATVICRLAAAEVLVEIQVHAAL